MKRKATQLGCVICSTLVLTFGGCTGWFRQSTTPTTAYKPVHQHALGGEVSGLDESIRKNPAALNLGDANGNTPLMLSAVHGHEDAVRFLLRKGALVDNTNDQHQTALMLAAKGGQRDVVMLLLRAKANVTIRDARGWNAQTWAEKQGYSEVAQQIKSASR
ncbi:MAG: ankyrin repeat and protein 6 [Verrucomicrobiota bacterium]